MKKLLLSLTLMGAVLFGKSQVILNEIYTQPGSSNDPAKNNSEFFELYNSSTNVDPIDLDCYQLIVYHRDINGFYVLDLPKTTDFTATTFFTGSAANPFNAQGDLNKNVNSKFNWNNLSAYPGATLKLYTRIGTTSGYSVSTPTNVTDLFTVYNGSGLSTAVFLFENGGYINGFMAGGGVGSTAVPDFIRTMPEMKITVSCGSNPVLEIPINWSLVTNAEYVGSNAGNDNGFARTSDGKCGTWTKTSSSVNHSPNRSNGSATGTSGGLTTTQNYTCPTVQNSPGSVNFNITGITGDATLSNSFAVDVQLYYDIGNIEGQLDGNDVYKGKISVLTLTEGQKSFVIPANENQFPVLLVYKTKLGCFDKIVSLQSTCPPPTILPVTYASFTATRSSNSQVVLEWETATEENNKGFHVQRNVNGEWKNIGFVFTQAEKGNSSSNLKYAFKDANSSKGISQYRILQVDNDGKGRYSEVRSIRGEEIAARLTVFPNPSNTGSFSILFEDGASVRDVMVSDVSGRAVKQYKGVSNSSLSIDNLGAGFYTVQVLNRTTGTMATEKVIIKKR